MTWTVERFVRTTLTQNLRYTTGRHGRVAQRAAARQPPKAPPRTEMIHITDGEISGTLQGASVPTSPW